MIDRAMRVSMSYSARPPACGVSPARTGLPRGHNSKRQVDGVSRGLRHDAVVKDVEDVQDVGGAQDVEDGISRRAMWNRTCRTCMVWLCSGCISVPWTGDAAAGVEGMGQGLSAADGAVKEKATSFRYREAKMVIRIVALRNSVPQQWLVDFKTALEGFGIPSVTFKADLKEIWKELEGDGKQKKTTADVVTVGDAWLQYGIDRNLIQPVENPERYRYWDALNWKWRRLVTRQSRVWGIPYRWGCTVVLYRHDRARRWGGREITDWDDLLHPGLQKRIAFLDHPREFVGIALKTLGVSYNANIETLAACGITKEQLAERVEHLAKQAKVMSNRDHVRAYAAGDVDVIVGNSEDIIPLAQKSSHSTLVVPRSGTALWADIWCVPKNASGGYRDGQPSPLLPAWFELGLQPVRARSIRGLFGGASPLLLPPGSPPSTKKCSPLRFNSSTDSLRMTDRELPPDYILEQSEFLTPLDPPTIALYRQVLHQD